jgi:CheY-like chemotaxis protein
MTKILIVDDEPLAREILGEFLTDRGFEVILAIDGNDGLRKYQEHKPQAALIDLQMPGMSGDVLTKTILKENKEFPIIILTGHIPDYSVQELMEAGTRALLEKPINLKELHLQIQKIIQPTA